MSDALPRSMPPWERPARLAAHIEPDYADPPLALTGQSGTWTLPFTLSRDVAPGAPLKLMLASPRNSMPAFLGLQCSDPSGEGFLTVRLENGRPLPIVQDTPHQVFSITVPPEGLLKGTTLKAVVATPAAEAPAQPPSTFAW